jgi:aarF domain-containing kinase
VATSISLDVLVLRRLAKEVRKWGKLNTNLPLLIDEWAASLFKELDYRQEAQNGIRFKDLYSHLEGVYVPSMYPELTTRKVLVMEWIDGERLHTKGSSIDPATVDLSDEIRLVEVGVRCSLEQLLEYGFYHADPHPGNLLRTKDGQLAYLDFGMMGEVDEKIRQGLIQATLHLVNREYKALADDFITLGMLPEDSDRAQIVPALTSVFAKALEGGVNNLSFGDLSSNLGRTMYQFKFQIPSYYTLLVRSLSVLEGIALVSNPDYKVLNAAYPWIARRLLTDTTPELQETLTSLVYNPNGRLNFKRLESLFTQATRSTGLPQRPRGAPSDAPPPRGDAVALILSSKGAFVRNIVVKELGKGVDALWRVLVDDIVVNAYKDVIGLTSGNATNAIFLKNLADMLASVPSLSTEEDREQLDGLSRLATALQKTSQAEGFGVFAASEPGTGSSQQTPCRNAEDLLDAIDWLVREIQTLTPEERQRALQMPLDIGANASQRVGARLLRWWFSEGRKPNATTSSEYSSPA